MTRRRRRSASPRSADRRRASGSMSRLRSRTSAATRASRCTLPRWSPARSALLRESASGFPTRVASLRVPRAPSSATFRRRPFAPARASLVEENATESSAARASSLDRVSVTPRTGCTAPSRLACARREWRSATVASPIPARAGPMRTAIRPVRFPTPRASAATPATGSARRYRPRASSAPTDIDARRILLVPRSVSRSASESVPVPASASKPPGRVNRAPPTAAFSCRVRPGSSACIDRTDRAARGQPSRGPPATSTCLHSASDSRRSSAIRRRRPATAPSRR